MSKHSHLPASCVRLAVWRVLAVSVSAQMFLCALALSAACAPTDSSERVEEEGGPVGGNNAVPAPTETPKAADANVLPRDSSTAGIDQPRPTPTADTNDEEPRTDARNATDTAPEQARSVTTRKGREHEWVRLPPGEFVMGIPEASLRCETRWKETPHTVTLANSFEIATTEITEKAFAKAMGYRPSNTCDDCPVANINWHELAAYCNWLSRAEAGEAVSECFNCQGTGKNVHCTAKPPYEQGRIYDCPGFRLMTEAEFEYALRAGTRTSTYLGDLPDPVSCSWSEPPTAANRAVLDRMAIYRPVSGDRTQPVAQKSPNAWGLYDLGGNVWEKTNDIRQVDLGASPATDPWGAPEGTNMVSRGGSFHYNAIYLRSGDRGNQSGTRDERSPAAGGRCVRSLR